MIKQPTDQCQFICLKIITEEALTKNVIKKAYLITVTNFYLVVKVRIHLRLKLINLINLHKVEHITSREAQEAQGTQRTQAVDVNASALNLMLCPKQLTRKRRCLCGAFVTRRGAWAPWVEKS